jgi:hypothetical protein
LGGQKPAVRSQTTGGKTKSVVMVLFLLLIGNVASAWAQGGSVAKGKALVESKKCPLCHKEDSTQGKPMEMLVGTNTDASVHCKTLKLVTGCIRSFSIDLEPFMNETPHPQLLSALVSNGVGIFGLVLAMGSLFAALCLIAI